MDFFGTHQISMQYPIANLLSKGCITAASFEQTTQDVAKH